MYSLSNKLIYFFSSYVFLLEKDNWPRNYNSVIIWRVWLLLYLGKRRNLDRYWTTEEYEGGSVKDDGGTQPFLEKYVSFSKRISFSSVTIILSLYKVTHKALTIYSKSENSFLIVGVCVFIEESAARDIFLSFIDYILISDTVFTVELLGVVLLFSPDTESKMPCSTSTRLMGIHIWWD